MIESTQPMNSAYLGWKAHFGNDLHFGRLYYYNTAALKFRQHFELGIDAQSLKLPATDGRSQHTLGQAPYDDNIKKTR